MSYWVVGWIAAAIGFVLGAAWAGLGIKNRQCDKAIRDQYQREADKQNGTVKYKRKS